MPIYHHRHHHHHFHLTPPSSSFTCTSYRPYYFPSYYLGQSRNGPPESPQSQQHRHHPYQEKVTCEENYCDHPQIASMREEEEEDEKWRWTDGRTMMKRIGWDADPFTGCERRNESTKNEEGGIINTLLTYHTTSMEEAGANPLPPPGHLVLPASHSCHLRHIHDEHTDQGIAIPRASSSPALRATASSVSLTSMPTPSSLPEELSGRPRPPPSDAAVRVVRRCSSSSSCGDATAAAAAALVVAPSSLDSSARLAHTSQKVNGGWPIMLNEPSNISTIGSDDVSHNNNNNNNNPGDGGSNSNNSSLNNNNSASTGPHIISSFFPPPSLPSLTIGGGEWETGCSGAAHSSFSHPPLSPQYYCSCSSPPHFPLPTCIGEYSEEGEKGAPLASALISEEISKIKLAGEGGVPVGGNNNNNGGNGEKGAQMVGKQLSVSTSSAMTYPIPPSSVTLPTTTGSAAVPMTMTMNISSSGSGSSRTANATNHINNSGSGSSSTSTVGSSHLLTNNIPLSFPVSSTSTAYASFSSYHLASSFPAHFSSFFHRPPQMSGGGVGGGGGDHGGPSSYYQGAMWTDNNSSNVAFSLGMGGGQEHLFFGNGVGYSSPSPPSSGIPLLYEFRIGTSSSSVSSGVGAGVGGGGGGGMGVGYHVSPPSSSTPSFNLTTTASAPTAGGGGGGGGGGGSSSHHHYIIGAASASTSTSSSVNSSVTGIQTTSFPGPSSSSTPPPAAAAAATTPLTSSGVRHSAALAPPPSSSCPPAPPACANPVGPPRLSISTATAPTNPSGAGMGDNYGGVGSTTGNNTAPPPPPSTNPNHNGGGVGGVMTQALVEEADVQVPVWGGCFGNIVELLYAITPVVPSIHWGLAIPSTSIPTATSLHRHHRHDDAGGGSPSEKISDGTNDDEEEGERERGEGVQAKRGKGAGKMQAEEKKDEDSNEGVRGEPREDIACGGVPLSPALCVSDSFPPGMGTPSDGVLGVGQRETGEGKGNKAPSHVFPNMMTGTEKESSKTKKTTTMMMGATRRGAPSFLHSKAEKEGEDIKEERDYSETGEEMEREIKVDAKGAALTTMSLPLSSPALAPGVPRALSSSPSPSLEYPPPLQHHANYRGIATIDPVRSPPMPPCAERRQSARKKSKKRAGKEERNMKRGSTKRHSPFPFQHTVKCAGMAMTTAGITEGAKHSKNEDTKKKEEKKEEEKESGAELMNKNEPSRRKKHSEEISSSSSFLYCDDDNCYYYYYSCNERAAKKKGREKGNHLGARAEEGKQKQRSLSVTQNHLSTDQISKKTSSSSSASPPSLLSSSRDLSSGVQRRESREGGGGASPLLMSSSPSSTSALTSSVLLCTFASEKKNKKEEENKKMGEVKEKEKRKRCSTGVANNSGTEATAEGRGVERRRQSRSCSRDRTSPVHQGEIKDMSCSLSSSSSFTSSSPSSSSSSCLFFEPIVSLHSIWKGFHFPFGCSFPLAQPVSLTRFGGEVEDHLVYIPLLSGFRIRFLKDSPAYDYLKLLQKKEKKQKMKKKKKDEGISNLLPPPHEGAHGWFRQDSPQEGEKDADGEEEEEDFGLLQWTAFERPDQRNMVVVQIDALIRSDSRYSLLLSSNSSEVDHQSWVSILWQPVFCGNHTAKDSCGSFLAFYLLRPPYHLLPHHYHQNDASTTTTTTPKRLEKKAEGEVERDFTRRNEEFFDNPVFRADHASVKFDLWTYNERDYRLGRPWRVQGMMMEEEEREESDFRTSTPSSVFCSTSSYVLPHSEVEQKRMQKEDEEQTGLQQRNNHHHHSSNNKDKQIKKKKDRIDILNDDTHEKESDGNDGLCAPRTGETCKVEGKETPLGMKIMPTQGEQGGKHHNKKRKKEVTETTRIGMGMSMGKQKVMEGKEDTSLPLPHVAEEEEEKEEKGEEEEVFCRMMGITSEKEEKLCDSGGRDTCMRLPRHEERLVRVPLVGLIPNRCRPEVWYAPFSTVVPPPFPSPIQGSPGSGGGEMQVPAPFSFMPSPSSQPFPPTPPPPPTMFPPHELMYRTSSTRKAMGTPSSSPPTLLSSSLSASPSPSSTTTTTSSSTSFSASSPFSGEWKSADPRGALPIKIDANQGDGGAGGGSHNKNQHQQHQHTATACLSCSGTGGAGIEDGAAGYLRQTLAEHDKDSSLGGWAASTEVGGGGGEGGGEEEKELFTAALCPASSSPLCSYSKTPMTTAAPSMMVPLASKYSFPGAAAAIMEGEIGGEGEEGDPLPPPPSLFRHRFPFMAPGRRERGWAGMGGGASYPPPDPASAPLMGMEGAGPPPSMLTTYTPGTMMTSISANITSANNNNITTAGHPQYYNRNYPSNSSTSSNHSSSGTSSSNNSNNHNHSSQFGVGSGCATATTTPGGAAAAVGGQGIPVTTVGAGDMIYPSDLLHSPHPFSRMNGGNEAPPFMWNDRMGWGAAGCTEIGYHCSGSVGGGGHPPPWAPHMLSTTIPPSSPPLSAGIYRAPLFLIASALQLMIWSAYEEGEGKWKRRKEKKKEDEEDEDGEEQENIHNTKEMVKKEEMEENIQKTLMSSSSRFNASGKKKTFGTSSPPPPPSYITTSSTVAGGAAGAGTNPTTSSSSSTTSSSNSNSHCYSSASFCSFTSPSPTTYYSEGMRLLRLAASRYRSFRDQVRLETPLCDMNALFPSSNSASSSDSGDPAEGTVPPAVTIAGGTNADILSRSALTVFAWSGSGAGHRGTGNRAHHTSSSGLHSTSSSTSQPSSPLQEDIFHLRSRVPTEVRVMAGLFDFYQWAQYDANLMEFAERYCKS